jgi:glycosyltransferase involved in cell wall biosynthesis
MNILWLNAGLLLPLDKGGKLRTWHVMRHLASRHDITYLSFSDPAQTVDEREGMHAVCAHLRTIPRTDPAKGTARFYLDAARYVIDPVPYAVAKYRSAAFKDALRQLLDERRFDAIVCDFLPPVVNLPERLPCPSILFTHNVEAEIWRRHAENARNPIARALLARQWRRMLRFEGAALSRFDLVLAVSDADRQTFQRLYPAALKTPAHVVQTGVDTTYFAPASAPASTPARTERAPGTPAEAGRHRETKTDAPRRAHLVFTGSMDWLPNEDGMLYFVREILPRVREAEPDATLSIVGRAPTPAVKRLADEAGIEVTGRVDDVRPHIAAGAVYIVPLRIGGGTRLKIFEAMAMGKAVVSTTVGAEGLPVTPGQDVVIADGPAPFAQAVVDVIRDVAARRRIETAARRLVVERYDWSAVAQDFEHALTRSQGLQEIRRSGDSFLKTKQLLNS